MRARPALWGSIPMHRVCVFCVDGAQRVERVDYMRRLSFSTSTSVRSSLPLFPCRSFPPPKVASSASSVGSASAEKDKPAPAGADAAAGAASTNTNGEAPAAETANKKADSVVDMISAAREKAATKFTGGNEKASPPAPSTSPPADKPAPVPAAESAADAAAADAAGKATDDADPSGDESNGPLNAWRKNTDKLTALRKAVLEVRLFLCVFQDRPAVLQWAHSLGNIGIVLR